MSIHRFCAIGLSIFLVFSASANAKSPKSTISNKQRVYPLLPEFKDLQKLEVKKIAEVIRIVRQFMLQQENRGLKFSESGVEDRWKDFAILLSPLSFANAEEEGTDYSGCKYTSQQLTSLEQGAPGRSFVAKNNNKCMIAGNLICLTVTGNRLTCDSQKIASDCGSGLKPCGYPAFMYKAENGTLSGVICRRPTPGKSFTQTCLSKNDRSASIDEIATELSKAAADSPLAKQYDKMKNDLETYCGAGMLDSNARTQFKGHYFDFNDCVDMAKRIAAIDAKMAEILKEKKTVTTPNCNFYVNDPVLGIPENSLQIKSSKQPDGKVVIEKLGSEASNWRFAKCLSESLEMSASTAKKDTPNTSVPMDAHEDGCLVPASTSQGTPYVLDLDLDEGDDCSVFKVRGSLVDFVNGKCEVAIEGYEVQVENNKAKFSIKEKDIEEEDLVNDPATGEKNASVERNPPYSQEVFVFKDKCLGAVVQALKTDDVSGTTPNSQKPPPAQSK